MSLCCFNLRTAVLMVSPLLTISREAWKYHYDDIIPKIPRRLLLFPQPEALYSECFESNHVLL